MPTISPPDASSFLTLSFALLAVLVAGGAVTLLRRARTALGHDVGVVTRSTRVTLAIAAVWMAAWWAAGASGKLARVDLRPPPAALLVVSVLVAGVAVATSRVGGWLAAGLPMSALIGFQAFRLPLELTMHQAASEGVMPVRMSFSGANFDILTGVLALGIWLVYRNREVPRRVALGFAVVGTALLITILGISLASSPLIRAFGQAPGDLNTWIFFQPFVWLPTVFVFSAIVFQLALFRRLAMAR